MGVEARSPAKRTSIHRKRWSMSSIKRDVKKKLLLRPEVESVSRDPAHGASMGKFSESILVVSSVAV
jgi:hypothetical protein